MTKVTVETTGNFQLLDRFSRELIPADKAVTVPHTPFIQERLDNGDLRLTKGELPEPEPDVPERENETGEADDETTATETVTENPPAETETVEKPAKRGRNR